MSEKSMVIAAEVDEGRIEGIARQCCSSARKAIQLIRFRRMDSLMVIAKWRIAPIAMTATRGTQRNRRIHSSCGERERMLSDTRENPMKCNELGTEEAFTQIFARGKEEHDDLVHSEGFRSEINAWIDRRFQ